MYRLVFFALKCYHFKSFGNFSEKKVHNSTRFFLTSIKQKFTSKSTTSMCYSYCSAQASKKFDMTALYNSKVDLLQLKTD